MSRVVLCAQIGPLAGGPVCCVRDADQQERSRACRAEDDGLRDADRPVRPATRHRRPPRRVHRVCTRDVPVNRGKKRLPSPPPDAVSHGKPDAPIRPDRRPFLSVHTSSPRATHGRSRGCKVRPAPEATSSPHRCIMRSITIHRSQPGVAPSAAAGRFARYSPMPTPR